LNQSNCCALALMYMKDSQRTKYAEMINVIANTCLMFCDRKSMSDHIDYDMETNNASSMVPFRQKSTFCELANEVSNGFDGDFDLETLLCDYKIASDCFASYFKRSYSIDLNSDAIAENKREQIFSIINFFNSVDTESSISEISFLNSEKISILKKIKGNKTTLFQAIFILLMVGLIPSYTSKKGSAKQIMRDFHLLMNFLREYARQANIAEQARSSPVLIRFETWVKENDEDEVRRIDLIIITKIFFDVVYGYSSAENTFLFNKQINYIYPDLDGFWSDNEIPGSHFWKFEKLSNGYYLYEYNLISENRRLEYTKHECYIYEEKKNKISFYVCHPTFMKKMVENDNTEFLQEWVNCKITENKECKITRLSFHPTIRVSSPLLPKNLYHIEDDGFYIKTLQNPQLTTINLFAEDDYTLILNHYAITQDYLYVILDKTDIRMLNLPDMPSARYLKIPKSLNSCLDMLTLHDEWGICNFNNGDCYFVVVYSMLRFKINTEEERKQFGFEIVDRIE